MKDFNLNENEMNENEMNKNIPNEENREEKSTVDNEVRNNEGAQNGNAEKADNFTDDKNINGNGFANGNGTYSFTRENIPNNTYNANPNNGGMNGNYGGAYTYNGNGGAYSPQNGQNANGQNRANAYSAGYHPQNDTYGANPNTGRTQNPYGFSNSYAPQNPTGYVSHGDGSIYYNPAESGSKKKKKERKSHGGTFSRRAVAVICGVTVLCSGLFGFGGAYIANSINKPAVTSSSGTTVNAGNTAVVYRSVEDVATSTGTTKGDTLTYSQVASIVKDSVVEIKTEYTVQSMWYQYVTGGAGSGVIISDDGYIITNNHVICDDSGSTIADNITVHLTNGEEYKAVAVGADADADIAVLKIDATGLTFAVSGNSDNLAVGEEVVVVGNPLGELGGTVTNGIVSATEREIDVNGVTMSLIQTNAAVNPGNSGGGMFNMKGELIGIVNAKSTGTGVEGLGFAIPINEALRVNEQLLEYGYVRGKTMIGVSFQEVSSSSTFMYYYNIKPGVYVAALTEGYNDDVLKEGDRVIAVNGNEVSESADIKAIVTASSVGDKLKFQLYRDGKLIEVEVTCYEKVPDGIEDAGVRFEEGND